jgi:hypothetical protein
MAYRDELTAAQARADALARRVKELEREKAELENRPVPEPERIVVREPAPPPERVVMREPAPARSFEDEHPGMTLFSKAFGGTGVCLTLAGLFGGVLWMTLTGMALFGIFVAGYASWRRRPPLPAAPPPQLAAASQRVELDLGDRRATAEVRMHADDATKARYDRASDQEIARRLRGVLADELDHGPVELHRRLRDRLEPLGFELVAVRIAAVGSGPVDPSDRR